MPCYIRRAISFTDVVHQAYYLDVRLIIEDLMPPDAKEEAVRRVNELVERSQKES